MDLSAEGRFLGFLDDEPLEHHGHDCNFNKSIVTIENLEDAKDYRAINHFRAFYKQKLKVGFSVNKSIEQAYLQLLTPKQVVKMGGLRKIYQEAWGWADYNKEVFE